jgi:hypothetical protein
MPVQTSKKPFWLTRIFRDSPLLDKHNKLHVCGLSIMQRCARNVNSYKRIQNSRTHPIISNKKGYIDSETKIPLEIYL